ncbi:hypothetical protein L1049_002885 [Liquidambar formosana]|uniref:Lipid II flippase MurJ n=1 Tax=Liquidambar formosana TaxID=63359 RepID=A0AAP0NID5_LIQFO
MGSLNLHPLSASLSSTTLPTHRYSLCPHSQKITSIPASSPTQSRSRIPHQFKPIQTTYCFHEPASSRSSSNIEIGFCMKNDADSVLYSKNSIPPENGLIRNAAWIGVATIISKIMGLLREIFLAAVFGIGPVATAFKYASVLPGFAASLLGGVNGPIHITMATTLSKLSKERRRKLFQHTTAIMFLVGGAVGILVFIFAEFIIHSYAPGLWILVEGQITRAIAIAQLKLMIPCIVFAGPVGLGFGYMSAEGNNILPSISPALSSMPIIAFCVMYVSMRRSNAFLPGAGLSGGVLISCGASLGAFMQWIIQVIMLDRTQNNSIPVSWINILKDKDVHEFFLLMLPATITSGLAQIASFTDLYFSSLIPGGAASLSYAYLLVMAPLGLLSSVLVLPLLPTFSRLAKTLSWSSLMDNFKRAVIISMVVVLPILSTMCALANPIICLLFQRGAFNASASTLVSSLFICYSLGSPFYVIRELLVAVFYALGDGQQPFFVSVAAIALNAILDWLFVSSFYLGAKGLALSTSLVTALSVVMLFHLLLRKLEGVVDYTAMVFPLLILFSCCIVSGFTTSITYEILRNLVSSVFNTRICRITRIQELFSISSAGLIGMIGFFLPLMLLHFSGFKPVRDLSKTLMDG